LELKKDLIIKNITKTGAEVALIVLILFLIKDLFNLIIFTFLFTYLMYNLQKYVVKKTHLPKTIVTIGLYATIIGLITFFIYKYIPEIIVQVQNIYSEISNVAENNHWDEYSGYLTSQIDFSKYSDVFTNNTLSLFKGLFSGGFNLFVALILSLLFILDINRIRKFLDKFETSKVSRVYSKIKYFGNNFLNSFGKVIQAQSLIAIVNSVLSTIGLWLMGFPQILGLAFMIFVLSFIPVAGVVVSLIPLSLVAFNIGGVFQVISVLVMIALLHSLESYILNPKLMSEKTSLPVFFIFVILIIGEKFMGTWGLLLGIPLFIFVLDILDIKIVENK